MAAKGKTTKIVITEPNFQTVKFIIRGTAPLMVHHFGEKSRKQMIQKQTAT
jgi:hypothetical protein